MTVALLTSQQPAEALALGARWARAGDDVTVVLLDAATAVLRPGHDRRDEVSAASAAGVRIWAHSAALSERAIVEPGDVEIDAVDLDAVAALIGEDGVRVQWW